MTLLSLSRGDTDSRAARISGKLQQRNRDRGETFAAAGEAETVRRRRAHGHEARRDAERVRESLVHLRAHRRDPRLLADEHTVCVRQREPHPRHLGVGAGEKVERRGAFPLRRGRGKEGPDVAEPGRADDGVDQRMRDHVAVGMAGEASVVLDRDAAEDERHALHERVRVDTDPDSQRLDPCRVTDRLVISDGRTSKLARPEVGIASDASSERLLAAVSAFEDGDGLVADLARERHGLVDVTADVRGLVGVGSERDRDTSFMAGLEERAVRIELADRLVQARGRDLDADARGLDRVGGLDVQVVDLLLRRAHAEEFDQVGMRKAVEEPATGGVSEPDEVAAPSLGSRKLAREPGPAVHLEAVDEVHRAEQVVPGIRAEDLRELRLLARRVVDFQAELDRKPAALCLLDGGDVVVEVVHTAFCKPRNLPQLPNLAEVEDVVAEADLVDADEPGLLDVLLRPVSRVRAWLPVLRVAQVHVVVDDHSSHDSTSARSSGSVTFRSRRSPSTTFTRPPRASTSEAQSLAAAKSPASASRNAEATNACGVWAATSSSRSSVSTT